MPTGDLDSENPTAVPFLVDEAAAAPWLVMVLADTVVAGIVLISIVFPEITVSIVEAEIVEAGIVDVIPPSSVIGMALPTPVAVHCGGMESVAVLGLADSSFE